MLSFNSCNFTTTAKLLVERGADVTKADKHSRTALHFAAQHGNKELCTILLDKMTQEWQNKNINAKDETGVCMKPFLCIFFIIVGHSALVGETLVFVSVR